jgi:SAM-dependent methyltransferase
VFVDESLWIRNVLERAPLEAGMTALDIGSSTQAFRTSVQPHIDLNVFAPLRRRGVVPVHLDARAETGVDIVADVTTLAGVERSFDLVICANLLEHVENRDATLCNVKRVVAPSGLLLVTVPHRYRLHADPIDTGFRPSAEALEQFVAWPDVLARETITIRAKQHYSGRRWLRRWFWPWQVACLLVRRPSAERAAAK